MKTEKQINDEATRLLTHCSSLLWAALRLSGKPDSLSTAAIVDKIIRRANETGPKKVMVDTAKEVIRLLENGNGDLLDLVGHLASALKCTLDGVSGYAEEHGGTDRYWDQRSLDNATKVLKRAEHTMAESLK